VTLSESLTNKIKDLSGEKEELLAQVEALKRALSNAVDHAAHLHAQTANISR